MMISLHLEIQKLSMRTLRNVPWCTQGLHKMGLNCSNNQTILFWLQDGIEIVCFNKLLHEINNFCIDLVNRHENMSHVTCRDML